MILVTGGTGFIGRNLVMQLAKMGYSVRTLLQPSMKSPNLPKGIAVEATVCSLNDERGLSAALKGVDYVFHLAGTERKATRSDLSGVDVSGTRNLAKVVQSSNIRRIFYLSHLGADKNSAFPVLKAKALAEKAIISSNIPHTIFRTSNVFGPGDQFVTSLARLLKMSPGFFLMPGDGSAALQPIWIEDLIACMILAIDDVETIDQLLELGGGEILSFREIVEMVLSELHIKRTLIEIAPGYLRTIAIFMDQFMPRFPISLFWLDTLAADRTTALDVLPRKFGIIPARFSQKIEFLQSENLPVKG